MLRFLESLMYALILSSNKENLIFSLPSHIALISLSYLIALAKTPCTILSKYGRVDVSAFSRSALSVS